MTPSSLNLALKHSTRIHSCEAVNGGVFGEPPGWSILLARVTRFLLPSLLPCSSKRACIIVPRDVSWSAVPQIAGSVGYLFLLVVHVYPGFFEEIVERPRGLNFDGLSKFSSREDLLSSRYFFM